MDFVLDNTFFFSPFYPVINTLKLHVNRDTLFETFSFDKK